MTKKTDFAKTPFYVLKSGNQPIYPTINFDDPNMICVCVYGFSDKPMYDKFIKNSGQPLTPYPLVQGYLSNEFAEVASAATRDANLRLIILDATGPAQPVLSVATMATVLLARQKKTNQVPVEFELVFDPETTGYLINNDFERFSATDLRHIVSRS